MSNPLKETPKSCSCRQCRRGKSCENGKAIMKAEERAARHQYKIDLKRGEEVILPAHRGTYTD